MNDQEKSRPLFDDVMMGVKSLAVGSLLLVAGLVMNYGWTVVFEEFGAQSGSLGAVAEYQFALWVLAVMLFGLAGILLGVLLLAGTAVSGVYRSVIQDA